MSRLRGDDGTIAPLVPVLAFVLLLLGGLVIDASRLLNARGRAVAYAEEAARAGASAIVPGQAELELDPVLVDQRVDAFCDALLADATQRGGVTFCDNQQQLRRVADDDPRELVVVVDVRLRLSASLLGLVGVEFLNASGTGSARPYEGVDPLDVDSTQPPVDVPLPEVPPGLPPGVEVPVFEPPTPTPLPTVTLPVPDPSATPTATPTPGTGPVEPTPSPTPSASGAS